MRVLKRIPRPHPLTIVAVGSLVVAVLAIWFVTHPPNEYVFIPDRAQHPLAPAIHVEGAQPSHPGGGLYWVDVYERRASWLDRFLPPKGATFVKLDRVLAPGATDRELQDQDTLQMDHSKRVAEYVALRAAGYKVGARPTGVFVSDVYTGSPASGHLQPSDVVAAVDGVPTPTPTLLRRVIRARPAGAVHVFTVRRGLDHRQRRIAVGTITEPRSGLPIVGIQVENEIALTLPPQLRIRIDIGNVGGPSAGLAFTLQLLQDLGRNVTHGYRVAATGTIRFDGSVGAIGAIQQKTLGARSAHMDVFLVPVDGDNAKVARRYAGAMRIISVTTFQQALHALATLPKKG